MYTSGVVGGGGGPPRTAKLIYIIIPKCACVCLFVQVLFENG